MPRKKAANPNDPMAILARIALEEQAEKANQRVSKEKSRDHALKQMHDTEREKDRRQRQLQKSCDHLLGSHRTGVIPQNRRCALHKDYLSDKSVRMYCGKCRFDWLPGDKSDFIMRKDGTGKFIKLPNPTGKSWREINDFFYSFENSNDLTSRACRLERVEPEDVESEEARYIEQARTA